MPAEVSSSSLYSSHLRGAGITRLGTSQKYLSRHNINIYMYMHMVIAFALCVCGHPRIGTFDITRLRFKGELNRFDLRLVVEPENGDRSSPSPK